MNLLRGDKLVVHGGSIRLPDRAMGSAKLIAGMIGRGTIASGDTIILLDAGRHECNPDLHEENWRTIRKGATLDSGVRLIICNTFDNFGSSPPPEKLMYSYSVKFGGRTMNEATEAAATVTRGAATEFFDLATPIKAFQADMVASGLTAYRPDCIHLNLLGSLAMCALLCRAADPAHPLQDGPFRRLAREHPRRLGATRPRDSRAAIERALAG